MADTFIGSEEELYHYGVKGMKWGKRKGSLKERIKGAHQDSLQRRITSNREIAENRGTSRDYFRRAAFSTDGTLKASSKRAAAARATVLEKRLDRVNKGKTKLSDLFDYANTVPATDLLISRRDRREDRSPDQVVTSKGSTLARNILLGVGGAVVLGGVGGAVAGGFMNEAVSRAGSGGRR